MMRLLILLMLVSQSAWAGWEVVDSGGSEATFFTRYWDPATVRKTADGRRAWVMNAYEQIQTQSGRAYLSQKILFEYDCRGERYRMLQWTEYSGPMGGGQDVARGDEPDRWKVVSPDSIGEAQLQAVCKVRLK